MTMTVARTESFAVSLPQQALFVLLVERDFWIHCGVNEYSVLVDVHEG
jgi:hypothetical protein